MQNICNTTQTRNMVCFRYIIVNTLQNKITRIIIIIIIIIMVKSYLLQAWTGP